MASGESGDSGSDAGAEGGHSPERLDSAGESAANNFGFYHREGVPSGELHQLSPEEEAARKKRNLAIAWSLVAFMVIVFGITVVRLSQNVANGAG